MRKVEKYDDLESLIIELESQLDIDKANFQNTFNLFSDSIKPQNILRSILNGPTENQEIKDGLINSGIGISGGYLAKKAFELISSGPVTKIIGSGIMIGVSSLLSKHPEYTQLAFNKIIQMFKKRNTSK
jgi:hypothetical protein